MEYSTSTLLKSLLILLSLSLSSSSATISNLSSIKAVCKSTPYPDACFNSLKLSLPITLPPNILTFLLHSLEAALSEGRKLSLIFSNSNPTNAAIQDCKQLHQITLSSLNKSISIVTSGDPKRFADARAFLSAALTNKNTCLEGLDLLAINAPIGLLNSLTSFYNYVSNSLSLLPRPDPPRCGGNRRRLLSFPRWLSREARRVLESSGDDGVTVAADGSGDFTTISDAVNFAPNNSVDRIIIHIRKGVYQENVEVPMWKTNIVFLGDGSDVTVISGKRSVGDGWTTYNSATVAVSGEGFLARDITFENTAGPEKRQAVALRVNADSAAVYRCTITGYQDTLYVHSFRQFYRECDIYGTIDYIFGNAAVVFQGCNIVSRKPMPGQFTVITAQSRDSPDQDTGISIQNCTVLATDELSASTARGYLGRPWREYSRTVYMESYIDGFVVAEGWSVWAGDQGLDTLYYGEYENVGPGSSTDNRVTWAGYRVMDRDEACKFTVSAFITGQEWLDSTSFPYDDGV